MSARDLQFGKPNGGQWLLGKTIDGCDPSGLHRTHARVATPPYAAPLLETPPQLSSGWPCRYFPIGPCIVTADSPGMGGAPELPIRCFVNGATMQESNTRQLVHGPAAVVAHASKFMTLKPGDMISTGTPGGVGCFRKPPLWLKHGDEVVCEIDRIGSISNRVQATPAKL